MRLAAVAFIALAVASPASAYQLTDDQAMNSSCGAYLATLGPDVHEAFVAAIVARLSASPNADRFGSACNMADYVSAECRAHPRDDLRRALDRLERAGSAGQLPRIPMCGA